MECPRTKRLYTGEFVGSFMKLMKRKALRKPNLHEKTAASVLLKLLISSRLVLFDKKPFKYSFKCMNNIIFILNVCLCSRLGLVKPISYLEDNGLEP